MLQWITTERSVWHDFPQGMVAPMKIQTGSHDRNCRTWSSVLTGLAIFLLSVPVWGGSGSVGYTKHWLYKTGVHVITINMNDPDVHLTPVVAKRGIGTSEGFGSLLSRTNPTAAITGTFFDTRSLRPTGDIVIDGDMVYRGMVGTAVGVDWNNKVTFIPTKKGRISDWSAYRHVLSAGPMILCNGKAAVYPRAQGFKDRAHFSPRVRTAVGVTKHNKLLLVSSTKPIYLSRLASIMKALGAMDAATLDGGGSTALYFRGRVIAHPSRRLTNLLAVYDTTVKYERAQLQISAGRKQAKRGVTQQSGDGITLQL